MAATLAGWRRIILETLTKGFGLNVSGLGIDGIKVITPKRHGDERGYFAEVFKAAWFRDNVANVEFVQDNESLSAAVGTVRGLHFQKPPCAQGKLVRCTAGALLDVAVDIRVGSPTFGQWVAQELNPLNNLQLWIPPGFAHGFITLQPNTVIHYKVTAPYSAEDDRGVLWNDPEIGIIWPNTSPVLLSDKDKVQPCLRDLPAYFEYP